MNKDEEYVRSAWKRVVSGPYHGMATHHFVALDLVKPFVDSNPNSGECWSAAAEFTRERVEQVRQLREAQNKFRFMCSALAPEEWAAMEPVDKLATVELTRLTAGMKPEAL